MSSTEETLKSWNFLKDYKDNRKELVDRAKMIYSAFNALSITLSEDQCKAVYGKALDGSDLFLEMAKKKPFLLLNRYRSFALLLANHVVEKNWTEIKHP